MEDLITSFLKRKGARLKQNNMGKKWKIAIVILFLIFVWIRVGPAIAWTLQTTERMNHYATNGYWGCTEENAHIVYDWSWWSLRFTDVRFDCDD